jgi:hypothetical protein
MIQHTAIRAADQLLPLAVSDAVNC